MVAADLPAVAAVTNTAFGALRGDPDAQRFPPLLFETRLTADPDGCFVAVDPAGPGVLTGALLSPTTATTGSDLRLTCTHDPFTSAWAEGVVGAVLVRPGPRGAPRAAA
jgi:hypothetical protein